MRASTCKRNDSPLDRINNFTRGWAISIRKPLLLPFPRRSSWRRITGASRSSLPLFFPPSLPFNNLMRVHAHTNTYKHIQTHTYTRTAESTIENSTSFRLWNSFEPAVRATTCQYLPGYHESGFPLLCGRDLVVRSRRCGERRIDSTRGRDAARRGRRGGRGERKERARRLAG